MKTYFISGHLDLTEEEFELHYRPRIDQAIEAGCSFVVGDARGADAMALDYLFGKTENVTVFHMFVEPRNNPGFDTHGGFECDMERDEALTASSNEDIAWVKPGRQESGTAKNVLRRKYEFVRTK